VTFNSLFLTVALPYDLDFLEIVSTKAKNLALHITNDLEYA